jgi:hypothetical protein
VIAASGASGTASLVACEMLTAAGAPIISPIAHAMLNIIDDSTSVIPRRSAESVMTAIARIV